MNRGLKVCNKVAQDIVEMVRENMDYNKGRVDLLFVKRILKPCAELDAELHEDLNPTFSWGGGPAVERK